MDPVNARTEPAPSRSRSERWHLPLLALVSIAFEAAFLHHGLNRLDEGWPLYAARQLHDGGTLYHDIGFVFPPGHLLAAWLGQAWQPPGLIGARVVYAAFSVAACLGLYGLGRRAMPPAYAFFGALLLAVAAPDSHDKQLLFGYRYLALAMLALLAFARRLDTGSHRWMFAAGAATGATLVFRLTPAFAAAAAIGIGLAAAERSPARWLRDGAAFATGLAAVAGPVVLGLLLTVGPEVAWREIVVRPVAMTDLQSLPLPPIAWPAEWSLRPVRNWFVGIQFRLYAVLYAGYALALAWRIARSLRERRAFDAPFLLALVVWGSVYFVRTLGRSDGPHLDSALPPACLLLAHAVSLLGRRAALPTATALLAAWLVLPGTYSLFSPQRGRHPYASTGAATAGANPLVVRAFDWTVDGIRRWSAPDDLILDLTASPLLYVLAERRGPGFADVVMPGTFLDDEEERRFVARLESDPPALVVWPTVPFDHRPQRGLDRIAPRLTAFVRSHYEPRGRRGRFALWTRIEADGDARDPLSR